MARAHPRDAEAPKGAVAQNVMSYGVGLSHFALTRVERGLGRQIGQLCCNSRFQLSKACNQRSWLQFEVFVCILITTSFSTRGGHSISRNLVGKLKQTADLLWRGSQACQGSKGRRKAQIQCHGKKRKRRRLEDDSST